MTHIELDLPDDEIHMILEALYEKLQIKEKALKDINEAGIKAAGREFHDGDFGIPKLRKIIRLFEDA